MAQITSLQILKLLIPDTVPTVSGCQFCRSRYAEALLIPPVLCSYTMNDKQISWLHFQWKDLLISSKDFTRNVYLQNLICEPSIFYTLFIWKAKDERERQTDRQEDLPLASSFPKCLDRIGPGWCQKPGTPTPRVHVSRKPDCKQKRDSNQSTLRWHVDVWSSGVTAATMPSLSPPFFRHIFHLLLD